MTTHVAGRRPMPEPPRDHETTPHAPAAPRAAHTTGLAAPHGPRARAGAERHRRRIAARRARRERRGGTPAALLFVPTAAGCPRAPQLALGPSAVAALLDTRPPASSWVDAARRTVAETAAAVAAASTGLASAGRTPILVGGDHTTTLGGVAGVRGGLARRAAGRGAPPPLFLLWLDAHPDANTTETSPTGNAHGMVLAGLLGAGPLALDEPLDPSQVVLAGARAFDPGEQSFLRARPEVTVWDADRLRGDGWRAPLRDLLRRVRRASGRLYVSLDLDVFDPQEAPGVVAPVPGGALPDPVLDLLDEVRRSAVFAGADVVELYPPADDGRTAALAAGAVEILAGQAGRAARAGMSGGGSRTAPAA